MIILTMPIPIVLLAIPLIRIMNVLKLMDSYVGLSLLYVSFIIPLTTWMSASYIQTIPQELEDAAHIDGCSRTQSFFRVILPLSAPVIGSVAIISFLAAWGGFFLPLIFAPSGAKQLTVVVAGFVGKDFVKKSLMAAGGTVAMMPPVLLVLFFSRFIISGLTKGALKE
jgi:multiple sugar transport system permease protein